MRTRMAVLSLLAAVAATAGGPVTYRWVDADGVHYSDQPHPGAEQITLAQPQTYSSGDSPVSSSAAHSPRQARGDTEEFRYSSCAVVQPAQDQVLIDVASATIAVQVEPAKRSGDHVVLTMDGQAIEPQDNSQTEFVIAPVDRGTHIVAATVRDAAGNTVCQSPALTFHVRQPTVKHVVTPH